MPSKITSSARNQQQAHLSNDMNITRDYLRYAANIEEWWPSQQDSMIGEIHKVLNTAILELLRSSNSQRPSCHGLNSVLARSRKAIGDIPIVHARVLGGWRKHLPPNCMPDLSMLVALSIRRRGKPWSDSVRKFLKDIDAEFMVEKGGRRSLFWTSFPRSPDPDDSPSPVAGSVFVRPHIVQLPFDFDLKTAVVDGKFRHVRQSDLVYDSDSPFRVSDSQESAQTSEDDSLSDDGWYEAVDDYEYRDERRSDESTSVTEPAKKGHLLRTLAGPTNQVSSSQASGHSRKATVQDRNSGLSSSAPLPEKPRGDQPSDCIVYEPITRSGEPNIIRQGSSIEPQAVICQATGNLPSNGTPRPSQTNRPSSSTKPQKRALSTCDTAVSSQEQPSKRLQSSSTSFSQGEDDQISLPTVHNNQSSAISPDAAMQAQTLASAAIALVAPSSLPVATPAGPSRSVTQDVDESFCPSTLDDLDVGNETEDIARPASIRRPGQNERHIREADAIMTALAGGNIPPDDEGQSDGDGLATRANAGLRMARQGTIGHHLQGIFDILDNDAVKFTGLQDHVSELKTWLISEVSKMTDNFATMRGRQQAFGDTIGTLTVNLEEHTKRHDVLEKTTTERVQEMLGKFNVLRSKTVTDAQAARGLRKEHEGLKAHVEELWTLMEEKDASLAKLAKDNHDLQIQQAKQDALIAKMSEDMAEMKQMVDALIQKDNRVSAVASMQLARRQMSGGSS